MRFRHLLVALAALAVLPVASRPASATIDGISTPDLLAQHAYLRTPTGIYYVTRGPHGLVVDYVSNRDSAPLFLVLVSGLKPYSPGSAEPPWGHMDFGPCRGDCGTGAGGDVSPPATFNGVRPADATSDDAAAAGSEVGLGVAPPSAAMVSAREPASFALVLGCLAGLLILEGARILRGRPAMRTARGSR